MGLEPTTPGLEVRCAIQLRQTDLAQLAVCTFNSNRDGGVLGFWGYIQITPNHVHVGIYLTVPVLARHLVSALCASVVLRVGVPSWTVVHALVKVWPLGMRRC